MAESTTLNLSSHLTKFSNSSYRHQSMNNEVKLKKRKRTVSVIHTTIRSPNTNPQPTNKNSVALKNNLVSFSTILSTRQQNSLGTQSLGQWSNTVTNSESITTAYPQHRLISRSQVNDSANDAKQKHIHQQDVDREQSSIRKYSSKSNEITHCQTDRSLNRNQSTNEYPTKLGETKTCKKRRHCNCKFCCSCFIPYALLSLLICLLLTVAIVATVVVTVVGVSTSSKSSTTTVPTTLTTTTIISTICSCLCANETWTFSLDLLARWSFDGYFNDVMNTYNATPIQTPTFVTNGYVNEALFFNANAMQSLSTSYIPLAYTSFTVEAWLKPTGFPNLMDHSILGLCPTASTDLCLHLVIRKIVSNYYLYLGFYGDDCQGNTSLTLNQWIHVAFVFDLTTLTQSIYLNGLLDNKCAVSSPFMASMGSVTIGVIPALIPNNNVNFFQGYIDHVSITKRAKSSCEIREDATLAACFTFDAAAPYTDFGPNSLLSNKMSTAIVSSGHSLEAVSFNGTSTSYFQALSFTGLGSSSQSFSIIFWIQPRSLQTATLVHVSQNTLGTGSWCYPFLGIASNGSLVAQIFNMGTAAIWGPSIPMSPVWSHVVETWSPTNGLRLYLNGVLVASNTLFTAYTASGLSNCVTLANSLSGYNYCAGIGSGLLLAPGPFDGDIDDFRVYSRELTATEIYTIYTS